MALRLRLWRWVVCCVCYRLCPALAGVVLVRSPQDEPQVLRAVALYSEALRADDPAAGITGYRASIDAYPHIPGAYNNLAMLVFEQSGDAEQVMALLERGLREAAAIDDEHEMVSIHNNMGYILSESCRNSIAHCVESIKHFDAALDVDASSVEALFNKASALLSLGEVEAAEKLLTQVLQLRPSHASTIIDLSRIRFKLNDLDRAAELLDRILDANEGVYSAFEVLSAIANKAVFLREAGHISKALTSQLQALEIAPDDPRALSNIVTMKRLLCDWNGLDAIEAQLVAAINAQQLSNTSQAKVDARNNVSLLPYDSTLIELSDAFRRQIAQTYSSRFEQLATINLLPSRWDDTSIPKPSRLRVGYLSFDFREHPMGHLTLALVEAHDRRAVEIYCFSYGYNDGSTWRRRFEERCDVFRDLENATDLQAAVQIARDEVDVLVDLMAHTKGARQDISALEPSRVIVNYLGFPGTSGSSYTHFALVDKRVMPPEAAATSMTESVVYLPTTYQANQYEPDVEVCGVCHRQYHHRRESQGVGTVDPGSDTFAQCVDDCQRSKRPLHGLPRDGIVFCNFNVNNKMDARSFALWMNILRQVPDSVLWLLSPSRRKSSSEASTDAHVDIQPAQLVDDSEGLRDGLDEDFARIQQSLRAQAAALGVSPSRIVFAPRVPKRVHLARVSLADVFLDSLVYNAHSTASDALWAHVPVVTLWGDTFPSRVAASLISHAVLLPKSSDDGGSAEMVAHSLKEYEYLAVLLARSHSKRLRLRAELAAQSLRCPLFDTKRTTEAVERALEVMHDVRKLSPAVHHGDERDGGAKSTRRSVFQVVVTPEQSRAWSDTTRASARMAEMKQLQSRLSRAGDAIAAGHVGARIELASMQLPASAAGDSLNRWSTAGERSPASSSFSVVAYLQLTRLAPSIASTFGESKLAEAEHPTATDPEDFFKFMALVDELCDRNRYADAVRLFETLGHHFLWETPTEDSKDSRDAPSPTSQQLEKAFLMLTFALSSIGRVDEAVSIAERALARYDSFYQLGYNLGALYRAQGHFDRSDEQQSAVAEGQSRHAFASWRGNPLDGDLLARKRARRPTGVRVIAFYCNEYSQSWWGSWGPSSARSSGLGGSEEAVVFLSQELARLGYWVEVYGSPPSADETRLDSEDTNGDRRAVSWYPLGAYDPDDGEVDVFIAWRYSVSLAVGKRARRALFWAHDVPPRDTQYSALLETVAHRIVCVSAFQAALFPSHLQPKTVILRNAVDDEFFTDGANDNHVFVYGSAPNRGLAQLLLAWPLVLDRLPNATLTVFYGFTPHFEHWAKHRSWSRVGAGALSTELTGYDEWRSDMDALIRDTPGVAYVGLINHSTLAQAYASAGFWLFPTAYPETSCISAMKAMANGAVPLTSRFEDSALSETIGAYDQGPIAISSAAQLDNVTWWGSQWADQISKLVGDGGELSRLRADMKWFARRLYRWSRVAREWHALISNGL